MKICNTLRKHLFMLIYIYLKVDECWLTSCLHDVDPGWQEYSSSSHVCRGTITTICFTCKSRINETRSTPVDIGTSQRQITMNQKSNKSEWKYVVKRGLGGYVISCIVAAKYLKTDQF